MSKYSGHEKLQTFLPSLIVALALQWEAGHLTG
ncbi:hypothetical protein ACVII1_000011 [Bradyrhizobium elkanii]|uniref:Transposase n=1 Tax=Bradyrhizobium elkanii TaxID=29448 RepID=A0ABV4ER76_BRAEL|nr:hypothetical protein [Bradyrhizobium elkanii]MCP1984904.1 hypothetical protein [Bradyrhizobium elkanii]MCS3890742.1 hypothetical protein [Bradyrhizobium elkanii]MCS4220303.1 hypothetical protein [Bradyrhizobium elkanii]MCW2117704.1 hypothetical protein [Bradyrhizobium elkanii]